MVLGLHFFADIQVGQVLTCQKLPIKRPSVLCYAIVDLSTSINFQHRRNNLMVMTNLDVVIMAGGKGTRMGKMEHKCKSLFPVLGRPALGYVLQTVMTVTSGHIILALDRQELCLPINNVIRELKLPNVEIYLEEVTAGTVRALYEIRHKIKTRHAFVLYGHHLMHAKHLRDMLRHVQDGNNGSTIVSLFKTSSNNPASFAGVNNEGVIVSLSHGNCLTKLTESEYFVDPPYLLPLEFLFALDGNPIKTHQALKKWFACGHLLLGKVATFPHEFHSPNETSALVTFAQKLTESMEKLPG